MKVYLFLQKLFSFVKSRIYVNETIILYQLNKYKKYQSLATIQCAKYNNLTDILYFQDKIYIDIFQNFLKMGDTGYFAYIDENCIHRSWVKSNNQIVYPHWTLPYKLKDNEIFIHYCETAPEARRKNIYPHVLSHISDNFKDKKILISVNKNNLASIRGIQKVGFEKKESVQTIVLIGIKFKRYLTNDKQAKIQRIL